MVQQHLIDCFSQLIYGISTSGFVILKIKIQPLPQPYCKRLCTLSGMLIGTLSDIVLDYIKSSKWNYSYSQSIVVPYKD